MLRKTVLAMTIAALGIAVAVPAAAQMNVAVIDVQRVVTESGPRQRSDPEAQSACRTPRFRKGSPSSRMRPLCRSSSTNSDSPSRNNAWRR